MFKWIADRSAEARSKMTQEVGRYKNKTFMEAVVSACALLAAADGDVSSAEKQKMMAFLKNSEELKVFATSEVVSFFEKITSHFDFDAEIGRAEALKYIGRVKDKPEQARLVVRVACAIGGSDGNFDQKEKDVVAIIARDLGLDPTEFV